MMHAGKTHEHLTAVVSTIPPFLHFFAAFYPPLFPLLPKDWLDLGGMGKAEQGGAANGPS